MPLINNTCIQDIVSFFNIKLDRGDSSYITYNDIEMIINKHKPKKLKIKQRDIEPIVHKPKHKPKKLKIKQRDIEPIVHKPKHKPKKLKIKQKDPVEFKNEYQYFIKLCSILNLPFYKYSTILWDGPAIIVPSWKNRNNNILKHIKIRIEKDILTDNHIAIHPYNYIRDDSITYRNIYNSEIEALEPLELTEWHHDGRLFYLDKKTNSVYETLNKLFIGERKYIHNRWFIQHN